MSGIFPLPVYTFLKIVYKNGGLRGKGMLRSSVWIIKTILFEPFRWFEVATKNKKIREHSISHSPIFIIGYYRSGTTYLQDLFRQDDRLGFMSAFQTVFPEIMLSCETWMTPILESIAGLTRQRNVFHRIPFTWHSTGEEDLALTTGLSPLSAQWGYLFPEKMQEYFDKYVMFENIAGPELQEWEKNYCRLLKKVSLANKGKQLVLKNPPNTGRIKQLLTLFPDAVFIHIRRNPYEVFASKKRLLKVLQENYSLGRTKSVDHNQIVTETYIKLMGSYLRQKDYIKPGRLIEIEYEDLVNDPVTTMMHIYKSLQIADFSYCETKMREYAGLKKQYAVLQHSLSDQEVKHISEKWGTLIRQLGYQLF